MKIVRYRHDGREGYGALDGDRIARLDGPIGALQPAAGATPLALGDVRLLAPTTPPRVTANCPRSRCSSSNPRPR
jgi:Rv2993c-like, N-terminal